jgi:hypothetical protein
MESIFPYIAEAFCAADATRSEILFPGAVALDPEGGYIGKVNEIYR